MQMGLDGSIKEAARSIYNLRGLRGFYAGYISLLCREVPFSGIQMPIYELLKKYTLLTRESEAEFSNYENGRNGIISGIVAALATNPIDVVKTRLMISREKVGKGMGEVGRAVYREEGLRGFYRASGVRIVSISVVSMIFFAIYESVKQSLRPSPH